MAQHVSTRRSRFAVAVSVAAVVASLTAGSVFAGEITGNGKSLKPMQGNSECAFSGLNDTPGEDGFGHTQSWGQLPKELKELLTSIGVSPGIACNGHLNPMR